MTEAILVPTPTILLHYTFHFSDKKNDKQMFFYLHLKHHHSEDSKSSSTARDCNGDVISHRSSTEHK